MSGRTDPTQHPAARGLSAALWVGIALLLVAEAIEYLRNGRLRTAHRMGDWLAEAERRQHRAAENVEIAVLARSLARRHR